MRALGTRATRVPIQTPNTMSPPNSRHSDPRNNHIASFVLERPVVVWCGNPM